MEVEGAGVVLDQGPAPAGDNEEHAGGKDGGAAPEEGPADGAAEEEAEAAGLGAPDEALGQMLQVFEQDVPATDVTLPELRGEGMLTGKRKREKELTGQPVGHSVREQGPVGAGFYARKGWTGGEGICSDSG